MSTALDTKEIDDRTWGDGFQCFADDAVARLGVGDRHAREAIRANLRAFVDKGFTAHHDVVEYWDVTTVGSPAVAAAQELRIESIFPVDTQTESDHAQLL